MEKNKINYFKNRKQKIEYTLPSKNENNNKNNIKVQKAKSYNLSKNNNNEKINNGQSEREIKNENMIKGAKIEEKLKNLFLEREKAKYKYNKQTIPDQLKYNSEDEESNYSLRNQNSIKKELIRKSGKIQNYFNTENNLTQEKNCEIKNDIIKNNNDNK